MAKHDRAFNRFQRQKRIRKYSKLCRNTWWADDNTCRNHEKLETNHPRMKYGIYGYGEDARQRQHVVLSRMLARTHTLKSEKYKPYNGMTAHSHSKKKRIMSMDSKEKEETIIS